jgi:hypothetical protein
MAAQGLDERLRGVVVHAIAMADATQPRPEPNRQAASAAAAAAAAHNGGSAPPAGAAATQQQQAPAAPAGPGAPLSAAAGLAALRLYTESLGRYGGSGAFMAPCYGAGALLEAFVRLAAVKGAVSVLCMGAAGLLVGEAAAAAAGAETTAPAAAGEGARRCRGVLLSNGQVITADTVVGGPELRAAALALGAGAGAGGADAPPALLARATCLLDGPLAEGDSSLLFVAPPGQGSGPAAASSGGSGGSQGPVVRGLQVGAAMQVAAPGRSLLYLTALVEAPGAGASASAEALLRPVLEAVADTTKLWPAAARRGGGGGEPGSSSSGTPRPKALAAAFYTQPVGSPAAAAGGVLACQGPDGGLVGYSRVLATTEALFRAHFPGLPWISEAAPSQRRGGGGGGGGGGGAGAGAAGSDDGEHGEEGEEAGPGDGGSGGPGGGGGEYDGDESDGAIDELQAALLELGLGLEAPAVPGGGGAPPDR